MTLSERLLALVRSTPPGTLVPVSWIAEQLDAEPVTPDTESTGVDFTVAEVALKYGRGASTVRTWLARGDLPGAYRLQGKEWRIPASALVAMQAAQREQGTQHQPSTSTQTHPAPLGAWRDHMPRDDKSAA